MHRVNSRVAANRADDRLSIFATFYIGNVVEWRLGVGRGLTKRMSDETEKSGARSAVILAIVVVLVAIFCIEFGLQTLVTIEARHWTTDAPWLADVPKPASLAVAAAAPKTEPVKAYGYQFAAPWTGNVKATPAISSTSFRFDSGQVVVLYDPGTEVDTLHQLQSSNAEQYLRLVSVFGGKTFDTNFALYKAVYEASPAQASPFGDRDESLRLNQLLLWKLSFGIDAQGGISSFDFGGNHGFQFGDPAKSLPVAVRIFNDRDEQFRLIFAVADGSVAKIGRDEINCVVQSLKHIPLLSH